MAELAQEIGRLADAAERVLERADRAEREAYHEHLRREWADPVPQFGLTPFLNAIPGLAAQFNRTVPDEFVAQIGEGLDAIACPCGQEPTVRRGALASCECGRWFLSAGTTIYVALSPTSGPPPETPAPVAGGPDTP